VCGICRLQTADYFLIWYFHFHNRELTVKRLIWALIRLTERSFNPNVVCSLQSANVIHWASSAYQITVNFRMHSLTNSLIPYQSIRQWICTKIEFQIPRKCFFLSATVQQWDNNNETSINIFAFHFITGWSTLFFIRIQWSPDSTIADLTIFPISFQDQFSNSVSRQKLQ